MSELLSHEAITEDELRDYLNPFQFSGDVFSALSLEHKVTVLRTVYEGGLEHYNKMKKHIKMLALKMFNEHSSEVIRKYPKVFIREFEQEVTHNFIYTIGSPDLREGLVETVDETFRQLNRRFTVIVQGYLIKKVKDLEAWVRADAQNNMNSILFRRWCQLSNVGRSIHVYDM